MPAPLTLVRAEALAHETLANLQTWNLTTEMQPSSTSTSRLGLLGQLSQGMLQPINQPLQPQLMEEVAAVLEDPLMFVSHCAHKNQQRSTRNVSSSVLQTVHKKYMFYQNK